MMARKTSPPATGDNWLVVRLIVPSSSRAQRRAGRVEELRCGPADRLAWMDEADELGLRFFTDRHGQG